MAGTGLIQALLGGALCVLTGAVPGATPLQAFDAEYHLFFEDKPVGRAFFRLRSIDDTYNFEAFTTPFEQAGDGATQHEVLEVSEGRWAALGPVPSTYLYSVRDRKGNHLFEQIFDWPSKQLHLQSASDKQFAPLELGTQDRISYLLRLAMAVANQETEMDFPVAEPEQTTRMRFRQVPAESITLGFDTVEATGVECFTNADVPDRTVWIAPKLAHLPVMIERATADGRVRMLLQSWREIPAVEP